MLNNTLYIGQAGPKGTPLSELAEGTLVKANEVGAPVEFYLAKHNYESGLNGPGKTLFVRKNGDNNITWDSGEVNAYAGSDIDTWFNGSYKNRLDPGLISLITPTKFYYTPGSGNTNVSTLERDIFTLSLSEFGESYSAANAEGSALPIASILKNYNNNQWTRTPLITVSDRAFYLSNGEVYYSYCSESYTARACFTLTDTVTVDDDLNIIVA